jgi:hypothetical protein
MNIFRAVEPALLVLRHEYLEFLSTCMLVALDRGPWAKGAFFCILSPVFNWIGPSARSR